MFDGFDTRRIATRNAEIFLRTGGSGPPPAPARGAGYRADLRYVGADGRRRRDAQLPLAAAGAARAAPGTSDRQRSGLLPAASAGSLGRAARRARSGSGRRISAAFSK